MATAMIRPGIMVSLKSTVEGGVTYKRTDLDVPDAPGGQAAEKGTKKKRKKGDAPDAPKTKVERWETLKVVQDPVEHERATKARNNALALIRKHCAHTAFGLLCPEANEPELDLAIKEARNIVKAHNETAVFTHVSVFALKGRIAASDEEAARAIGEEVRTLISGMNASIDRLDPKGIREAADKAKQMASMLAAEQNETVSLAIEAARKAARTIVARVEKKGEKAAIVLADIQRGAIEKARMAFLDFDAAPEATNKGSMPSVDLNRFDLDIASGSAE